jgi:hypothetical protein
MQDRVVRTAEEATDKVRDGRRKGRTRWQVHQVYVHMLDEKRHQDGCQIHRREHRFIGNGTGRRSTIWIGHKHWRAKTGRGSEASSSAGDHGIIQRRCVSVFIQWTCRNAGDEDGVSSNHVSTSGNRRAEERRETEAARGRSAKRAKEAANGQHGRRGRHRTLNVVCAGSNLCT